MARGLQQVVQPEWRAPATAPALGDVRFRRLLGAERWARLPQAVRHRFAKRLGTGQSVTYDGQIIACRLGFTGWLLAQACRLIGAPLPLEQETGVAAIVTVTEDGGSGGQVWTRMYARRHGFPQVIHSAKRFAGPTGLEEYLGGGFGIALSVDATDDAIVFTSHHYFLKIAGRRFRLPAPCAPGHLTIEHRDTGAGTFLFSLTLHHPLFGTLITQTGAFRDRPANPTEDRA